MCWNRIDHRRSSICRQYIIQLIKKTLYRFIDGCYRPAIKGRKWNVHVIRSDCADENVKPVDRVLKFTHSGNGRTLTKSAVLTPALNIHSLAWWRHRICIRGNSYLVCTVLCYHAMTHHRSTVSRAPSCCCCCFHKSLGNLLTLYNHGNKTCRFKIDRQLPGLCLSINKFVVSASQ